MSPLKKLLEIYRENSLTEREKGNYFEELIVAYLKHEATYADLYESVWLYSDWAKEHPEYGLSAKDTGIDLVAKTSGTDEFHAIQCKCYAEDYKLQKKDIDSFFTASGQKPFTHRIIVSTTNNWSDNAEKSLFNQHIPVSKIDLHDLETSQIDWSLYKPNKAPTLKPKKDLRAHQQEALAGVKHGLSTADRGKLIMACGTGKTFTSLKIAENLAGHGKRVLFLVPSLSLLSQTLTEWTQESKTPLHSFAVCSDSDVGKQRQKGNEDIVQTFSHELRYPATTQPDKLAKEFEKRHDNQHMSVVFSTYHSIDVISKAQKLEGLEEFDLIICDEAHRTTGSKFAEEDESNFVKIHDADFIKGKKRLYMTATPRIYAETTKASAEKDNVALYGMDDVDHYGKELFVLNFSEAVRKELLVDYKVIVLAVDEHHVNSRLQNLLSDENNSLKVDDAAKIVGCWKALSKQGAEADLTDINPMRRAVAFCQVIEANNKGKTHKVSSKQISGMFQEVVEAYQEQEENHNTLICEAEHVDGSMNASEKDDKLEWLKAETPENTCRILSNVRCLSEGVDVPALDAVLFLTPRNSPVDVVQSVGRVMRKAPGKELGYVILPVVIPAGMAPSEALNDNQVYKIVWEVLQALRSHDDRFDATINKLDLNHDSQGKIEVVAVTKPKMEVEHTVDHISKKSDSTLKKKGSKAKNSHSIGNKLDEMEQNAEQYAMEFEVGEIERALYAKVVKKCGNRNYWADWAKDIAKIANTHISRITTIVSDENNKKEVKAFNDFANELRDDLNDSITDEEVIEMLAQHLITKPVFDALFEEYSFANNNPVSLAMQKVLDILNEHSLDKERDTLEQFYESVRMRADGINNAEGKQKIVVELYDKFFKNAFPRMTERLGIVYTPVEVVDFIIHSVNDILLKEFNQNLGSEGVHIIDPFTGTGTFITRLLQSGLISKDQLEHKYKHEIHANEIVLLAYYIAAINIESVYHGLLSKESQTYEPFEGICLTDTFQLWEKDDMVSDLLSDNSDRRNRQKDLDIRVIIGNPPYSAGQSSANDNNQNVIYENLDQRIRETYVANTAVTNKKSLYDSYIRAIRWGSDRIGKEGVLSFVSGSAWVERPFGDGIRKCLEEEFSSIYVFHLRGDIRKNILSKGRAKEGENIFGSGSMTGISITVLVKNSALNTSGKIYFYDIGDDLSEREKLDKIKGLNSIEGIRKLDAWKEIYPNDHFDWINQRDESFQNFIQLGNKKDKSSTLFFETYSSGVKTNRDTWCYGFSNTTLKQRLTNMIAFFNGEVERYVQSDGLINAKDFVEYSDEKFKWCQKTLNAVEKGKKRELLKDRFFVSSFRPFQRQYLYTDNMFAWSTYLMPSIFPTPSIENLIIMVSGVGARAGFSAFILKDIPSYDFIEKGQCFPLYIYEKTENSLDLFSDGQSISYRRKDGITDACLEEVKSKYLGEDITKETLFYYIYGILHSTDYAERYSDSLSKELPRIPFVNQYEDFSKYSEAGKKLAQLHLNFDKAPIYPVTIKTGKNNPSDLTYHVEQMKFETKGHRDSVIYNSNITIKDIPLEAYDYVVNGKPALEWVMERQAVKTDKKTKIINDANLWATETMNNPKYPLELFQRVITVSLETMKIVNSLPKLDIE